MNVLSRSNHYFIHDIYLPDDILSFPCLSYEILTKLCRTMCIITACFLVYFNIDKTVYALLSPFHSGTFLEDFPWM